MWRRASSIVSSSVFLYSVGSIAVSAAAIAHAFITRKQFYNAVIFLTTAKLDLLIIGNLLCMLTLLLGKAMLKIFLDRPRGFEVENLIENGKYAVTETCLAVTTFRQEIDFSGVFLFASLLFFKCFHWLLASRIEHVGRTQDLPILQHVRLLGLLVALFLCDLFHVVAIISTSSLLSLASPNASPPTVHLLFAFEFTILLTSLATLALKYVILMVDAHMDNQWDLKPIITFYVDLLSDLIRLFLYVSFFIIVCSYFGLPLHLIRELYVTFHTLRERITTYLRYKRLILNLHERFPDATPEQIAARSDDQCIICREEMRSGKALPCSHLFHFHCLRTWLERSNTCPICRVNIPDLQAPLPVQAEPAVEAADAPVEVPVAAMSSQFMPAPTNAQSTHLSSAWSGGATFSTAANVELPTYGGLFPEHLTPAVSFVNTEAHMILLQQHALSIERQIQFHTNCLTDLSSAYEQVLNLQQQCASLQTTDDDRKLQEPSFDDE